MTHDELIAYIDDSTDGLKHEHLFEKLLANTAALRAVVELVKPSEHDSTDAIYWKQEILNTIEKELK